MQINELKRSLSPFLTSLLLTALGCAGVRPCPVPELQVEEARRQADAADRGLAPIIAQRDSLQKVVLELEAGRDSLRSLIPDEDGR